MARDFRPADVALGELSHDGGGSVAGGDDVRERGVRAQSQSQVGEKSIRAVLLGVDGFREADVLFTETTMVSRGRSRLCGGAPGEGSVGGSTALGSHTVRVATSLSKTPENARV